MTNLLSTISRRLIRIAARAAYGLLKAFWFIRRPRTFGAHAVALTSEGRLILVKLRYASGWRLPGGGRAENEDAREAALREMREEIGMISHGVVQLACELEESVDFKRDLASVVIVHDVSYRPKTWNLEVEAVREVDLESLPADLSPQTKRWLKTVRPLL
jgi:8-oxo-dGTP pyrophosphatase MutT (NUDIX family)